MKIKKVSGVWGGHVDQIARSRAGFGLSAIIAGFAFLLMFELAFSSIAGAATIKVDSLGDVPLPASCNLRQAIVSHNTKSAPFPSSCEAGSGDDTIVFPSNRGDSIPIGSPLPPVENGSLTIKPPNFSGEKRCFNLRQAAYMTVNAGATLTLSGISVVVNGAEFLSIIDNNGGTLNIAPYGDSGSCLFSNQSGRDRKTTVGGVLHNRNGGVASIDANFRDSSAGTNGGAIYVDSGTVNITGGNFTGDNAPSGGAIYVNRGTVNITGGNFTGNNAPQGGAIYVNSGANLNSTSSHFSISDNQSSTAGAAIYNNGGNISIQRDDNPAGISVNIAKNRAGNGAAIYSNGGTLSIDQADIHHNSSTSFGTIVLNNRALGNLSQVSLHDNNAGIGGAAIALTTGAAADITQSHFFNNAVKGNGGAILEDDALLNLTQSDVHHNTADPGSGGGLLASNNSDTSISDCTFYNNSASESGSSIQNSLGSQLSIINSTFLGRTSAPESITLSSGKAAIVNSTLSVVGLDNRLAPEFFNISNSILRTTLCNNVRDDGMNLQFASTSCPVSIPNMNPLLDPNNLRDNGGPTLTIALRNGSPAIDAISLPNCVDQNGLPVTHDQRLFPRGKDGYCDIGAYEAQKNGPPTPTPTSTSTSAATATPTKTATPVKTATPTASATIAPTASGTSTRTATPTSAPTTTATRTATPTPAKTATPTASATSAPTASATPTRTASPTSAPTTTATTTPTRTATATPARTATATATATHTKTATATPTRTATPTVTATATRTATATPTRTPVPVTPTPTATPSSSIRFVAAGPLFDSVSRVTGVTVGEPSGVISGDALVTQILVFDGTASNVPMAPPGWTLIRHDQIDSGNHQLTSWLYYRVASGSESSSYTWSISKEFAAALMGDWRGASTTPLDQSSGAIAIGGPASAAAPSLTPANNNELQLYFYGAQNSGPPHLTEPAAINARANERSAKEGFAIAFGDLAAPFMGIPSPTFNATASGSGKVALSAQAVLLKGP